MLYEAAIILSDNFLLAGINMESLLKYGYAGLFILAFLAATIIPFSSDAALVAFLAVGGDPVATVLVATVGNWLGGLTSYWLGRLGKWEWLEKYFKVKRESIEKQQARVDRYGSWLALLTWLPLVGDLLAIALGFFRLDFWKVAVFMFIGKGARYVMWALFYFLVKPWLGI